MMKSAVKIGASITIAVMLALFVVFIDSCKKEEETIKIGAIVPLTGSAAEFGIHEQNALVMLEEEINSNNGVNGKLVSITFEDSQGDPKTGVSALQKLILGGKPIAIFSELSAVSVALSPVTKKHQIIQLSVAANPDVSRLSEYAFRVFPDANKQAEKFATVVKERLNVDRVGFLFVNDEFGRSMKESFESRFTQLGGMVVAVEGFEADSKDVRTQVLKIIAKKPEAVYVIGYGKPLGIAIKQMREMGYEGTILSGLEVGFEDVLVVAGEAAEGVVYLDIPFDPYSEDPKIKEFIDKYYDRYGILPMMTAPLAYDSISLVVKAIEEVGEDPAKIRDFLLSIKDWEGVSGKFSISEEGDFVFELVLKIIKDGKPKVFD